MRVASIGFVSTYPPIECGVGEYTRMLVEALLEHRPRLRVYIFTPRELKPYAINGVEVIPAYERGSKSYETLLEELERVGGVDVLHVQHEYGIFGDTPAIFEALLEARRRGLARVVAATLHTVYHPAGLEEGREARLEAQRAASKLDAVVTHTVLQEFELLAEGFPANRVHRIPHGTSINPYSGSDRNRLLEELGLDPAEAPPPRIVVPGFLRPDKGLDTLLEAVALLRERGFGGSVVVAGRAQGRGGLEAERVIEEAVSKGLVRRVNRFLESEDFLRLAAAADVIVLPYRDRPGKLSASGVLHVAMGTIGRVVVGTRVARLVELYENAPELVTVPGDAASLARLLERVLRDPDWALGVSERVWAYGIRTGWRRVAAKHLELYDSLLGAA